MSVSHSLSNIYIHNNILNRDIKCEHQETQSTHPMSYKSSNFNYRFMS